MINEIYEIYQQSLLPNTEVAKNANSRLLSIYEDPRNIELLFSIFQQIPDQAIKMSTLLGIKQMMNHYWESIYNENQFGENIKTQLLLILQASNHELNTTNLLVDCLKPILATQAWQWTDLLAFLNQTLSITSIQIVESLLQITINKAVDFSQEILTFSFQILQKCIESKDSKLIIQSSSIFALLSSYLPAQFSEVLGTFFQFYATFFGENTDLTLARSIGHSFNSKNPSFDANAIFAVFIELSTKTAHPEIVYIPLKKLISKFGAVLRPHFPLLIQTTYSLVQQCYSEQICYNQSENGHFLADIVRKCLKQSNKNQFAELLQNFISTPNSIEELYSLLEILFCVIEPLDDSFSIIKDSTFAIILNALAVPNHLIQELSIYCLIDILSIQNLDADFEPFFQIVYNQLNSQHPPLIILALKAISLLFDNSSISKEVVAPIIGSFLSAAEQSSEMIKANMILVICYIIYIMEEDIAQYVLSIAPLLIKGTEDEDEEVQRRSIEALGVLILYSPEACESIIQPSLTLFVNALESDTLFEGAYHALRSVSKSSLGIDPFLQAGIIQTLGIKPREDEIDSIYIDKLECGIHFLDVVIKNRPGICEQFSPLILQFCLTNLTEELFVEYSSMAIMRILNGNPLPSKILDTYLLNVESDSSIKVASTFKAANYLLKHYREPLENEEAVNSQFLQKMFQLGVSAIKRELPCQNSDEHMFSNYDPDVLNNVIKFISLFSFKNASQFPAGDYFELIKSLYSKVSQYETEFSLMPLVSYETALQEPTAIDQSLIEFAFHLISNECGTNWPYQLIRSILVPQFGCQKNEGICDSIFPQLCELCVNYMNKFCSALTLLFIFSYQKKMPVDQLLPKLIECIPINAEVSDLIIIWKCVFEMIPHIRIDQQQISVLVQRAAETIDFMQEQLPESLGQIIRFIKQCIETNPNLAEVLSNYNYTCKLLQL